MARTVWAVVLAAAVGATVALAAEEVAGLGHGGALVGLLTLDFSPLNAALTGAGYPGVEGPMVVFGGGGGGGILGGIAFGGLGFGGTLTKLAGEKRTDLELSYGGVVIELNRPAGRTAVLGLGIVLGGGSLDLTTRARYPVDFADSLATPPVSQLSLGFFAVLPYLRLQLQVLPWLAVDGWAGYFLSSPGPWEEGGREIAGPRLDLRAPFFGVQLAFGGIGLSEENTVPPRR